MVETSPHDAGSPPLKRPWHGVVALAGGVVGVVGLASLVYVIGAVTTWLALRDRDYDPDAGIEHKPRSELIALGFRGIFLVAVLTLVAAAIAWAILAWKPRGGAAKIRFRYVVIVSAGAILLAALFSWRWLAVAIVGATLWLLLAFHLRMPRYKWSWQWLALPLAAALAAISWQYGGTVYVTSVEVEPLSALPVEGIHFWYGESCKLENGNSARSSYTQILGATVWLAWSNPCGEQPQKTRQAILAEFREVCSVPYFGQTSQFVYVGALWDVYTTEDRTCYFDSGPIVELRRNQVRLRYLKGKTWLNHDTDRPIGTAWDRLTSFFGKFD